jgi:general secretion pathway protein C
MVFGQAKLVAVYADRVEIDRSGTIEILKLDDTETQGVQFKDGVATVGNDEFLVDEKELDKALENLPLLLTQARAVPYFEQGKAVGIRLFAIKTTSLFEKIGLQNGDVLRTINGNSLADLSEAMKLFERLKQERSISVTLTRNGAQKEFKYQIQ